MRIFIIGLARFFFQGYLAEIKEVLIMVQIIKTLVMESFLGMSLK